MRYFNKDAPIIRFAMPDTKLTVSGICTLLISAVSEIFKLLIYKMPFTNEQLKSIAERLAGLLNKASSILLAIGVILIATAIIVHLKMPDKARIKYLVRKGLYCYEYGNPLHLKDGERLPEIKCKNTGLGVFELTVKAVTCTVEDIQNISSSISSSMNKKGFKRYAVTQTSTDIAFNDVTFRIEDVTVDRSLTFNDVNEMKPKEHTKLIVQKDTYIDLTTSGSMLIAGKTRSGKTTGIISLLLQALLCGRDYYGSEIIIIDPKQAELSRLPHVVTLDENGEATAILDAMKRFCDTIVKRQKVLNDLSEKTGDAVKWWEAGMNVSFLFIDEYVACRTMFPNKPSKDNPDYCLANVDGLIRRIVTMGASAGCYAIISIAQASVSDGGLPSMLRDAMTTKILFKPTLDEGRLLWDSDKLKDFNCERVYNAGDAWFSSTDGIHDNVSYVHFPYMKFKVYGELGRLLNEYYNKD